MYPYRPGSNFLSLPGCMPFRAQLFKGRVTLSKGLIAIQRITANITYCAIHWIEIYPVITLSKLRTTDDRPLEF